MARVYEFDPVIYPCRLWIAVTTDNLADRFRDLDDLPEDVNGRTSTTSDINRGIVGVIIRFRSIEDIDFRTVAHESVHAANMIFYELGVKADTDNDEHLAYLVGWIADCCREVRSFECKKKPDKSVKKK